MTFQLKHDDLKLWEKYKTICRKNDITVSQDFRRHISIVVSAEGDYQKIAEKYNKLSEIG